MNARRSILAAASFAVVLTACGASAPPARELALEMVDTLDVNDDVKACMRERVEEFQLTEEEAQGFNDLDEVFEKADEDQAQALVIVERFESTLAGCR